LGAAVGASDRQRRFLPGGVLRACGSRLVQGHSLRDGDLVSIDCGAELDGWTGDAAVSFTVGTPRPADLDLINATQKALDAGIAAAVPGNRMGDISHAIGSVARSARCGMPADFGGHGIGRQMHEDPHVPNRGRPGRGFPLRHGLTLAIGPMLMAGGSDDYRTSTDGWTLLTKDGSRAQSTSSTRSRSPKTAPAS
jgi:methionyl aminopeptidase